MSKSYIPKKKPSTETNLIMVLEEISEEYKLISSDTNFLAHLLVSTNDNLFNKELRSKYVPIPAKTLWKDNRTRTARVKRLHKLDLISLKPYKKRGSKEDLVNVGNFKIQAMGPQTILSRYSQKTTRTFARVGRYVNIFTGNRATARQVSKKKDRAGVTYPSLIRGAMNKPWSPSFQHAEHRGGPGLQKTEGREEQDKDHRMVPIYD